MNCTMTRSVSAIGLCLLALSYVAPSRAQTLWNAGYGTDNGWGQPSRSIVFGDVNGDKRADMVAVGVGSASVSLSLSAAGAGDAYTAMNSWNDSLSIPGFIFPLPHPFREARAADVTGDGADDLVLFTDLGVEVMVSKPAVQAFSDPELWSHSFGSAPIAGAWGDDSEPIHLVDINGDGRKDVVGFQAQGIDVALSTGTDFAPVKRWLWGFGSFQGWTEDHPRRMADVNGDGRTDVIGFSELGPLVALSTGKGFEPATLWVKAFGASPLAGLWESGDHELQLADVNGDGRDDVIGFYHDGTYVGLSTGNAFEQPELWVANFDAENGWETGVHQRSLGDVNGDGMVDVVGFGNAGAWVSTSTGVGFGAPALVVNAFGVNSSAGSWSMDEHTRVVADSNGDGLADILGVYNNGIYVFRSTPPPLIYGHPEDDVDACYAPIAFGSVQADNPTAELNAQIAAADALKASCAEVCEDTQPYISDAGLCPKDSFWLSPCGMLEQERMSAANGEEEPSGSECFEHVGDYVADGGWTQNGDVGATVKPETTTADGTNEGGVQTGVSKQDYSRAGQKFTGMHGHYYGGRMRNWTNLSANDPLEQFVFSFGRALMQGNGPRVTSCFELVFEKYHELARFFDNTAAMGHDHWAMFDLAYHNIAPQNPSTGQNWKFGETFSPEYPGQSIPAAYLPGTTIVPDTAIGRRGILGQGPIDVVGSMLDPLFPADPRNKNAYFDAPVDGDPAHHAQIKATLASVTDVDSTLVQWLCLANAGQTVNTETCPWLHLTLQDDSLYSTLLDGRQNHTYVESWQWHEDHGNALRDAYLEEELEILQFNQERFLHLLKLRHDLVQKFYEKLVAAALKNQEYLQGQINQDPIQGPFNFDDVIDPVSAMLQDHRSVRSSWLEASLVDAALNQIPGFAGDLLEDLLGGGIFLIAPGAPGTEPTPVVIETDHGLTTTNGAVTVNTTPDVVDAAEATIQELSVEGIINAAKTLPGKIEQANLLIEAELEKAKDLGCLDLSVDNPCDWSPKRFVQRLQDHFEAQGELDYQRCLDEQVQPIYDVYLNGASLISNGQYPEIAMTTTTGDQDVECRADTIASKDPYMAGKVSPSGPGDWAAAPRLMEYYPRCLKAFEGLVIDQAAEALGGLDNVFEPGSTTDISLAQADSDSTSVGDSKFGLTMGYDFGWRVPTFESISNCQIDPYVNAQIYMKGKVFGIEVPIFDAGAKAGIFEIPNDLAGASRQFEADAWVELLTYDLLNTDVFPIKESLADFDYHVIVEGDPTESWQETLIQTVVTIGPVPLTLKAGIAGKLGLAYQVAGGVPTSGNCDEGWLRVNGELSPHAGLDVFASASIDLLLIEAGIQANLTLIELALPFRVDLSLKTEPPEPGVQDSTFIELATTLDLRTSFLSGALKAFVKICYIIDCETIEGTIFEWDGPAHTINLFTANSRIDLGPLRTVQSIKNGG